MTAYIVTINKRRYRVVLADDDGYAQLVEVAASSPNFSLHWRQIYRRGSSRYGKVTLAAIDAARRAREVEKQGAAP
jgi:hypothetical protein